MSERILFDINSGSESSIYNWSTGRGRVELCRDPNGLSARLHVQDGVIKKITSETIYGLPPGLNAFSDSAIARYCDDTYAQLRGDILRVQHRCVAGMFHYKPPTGSSDLTTQLYRPAATPSRTIDSKMNERGDQKFKILALDGGGIRGVIPARVLVTLEEMIGPVHETFDLIGGTSTGAIIGLGLTRPPVPMSARDILNLYVHRPAEIFTASGGTFSIQNAIASIVSVFGVERQRVLQFLYERPLYTDVGLKRVSAEMFGEAILRDTLTNVVIPTVDVARPTPLACLFSNLDERYCFSAIQDAAMASAAAPTYFPYKRMQDAVYVDGGLIYNNPAVACMNFARDRGIRVEGQYLLSIGTGFSDVEGLGEEPAHRHNLMYWARNLFPMVDRMSKQGIHEELNRNLGNRYLRLDPQLEEEIGLDDLLAVTRLLEIAEGLVEREHDNIRDFARGLRPDRF